MSLFIYKRANALSRFSCILGRKYVLISFRAVRDRLPVAVVTGNVAKICSDVSVIEYIPSCLAVLRAILFQQKYNQNILSNQSVFLFVLEMLMCSA